MNSPGARARSSRSREVAAILLVLATPGCGLSALVGSAVAVSSSKGSSGSTASPPPPRPASVAPASASHRGGDMIVVKGENFVAGATVAVGGQLATGVTVVSSTELRFMAPAVKSPGLSSIVVTNAQGGAGTIDGAFTYTNVAATGALDRLASPQSQNVVFAVVLSDAESDPVDLRLEYATGGGAFQPIASGLILSGGTQALPTTPAGTRHSLTWDTRGSFPATNAASVRIRVTPVDLSDGIAGAPVTSEPFDVRNNAPPQLSVSRPGADSFEVAITYQSSDPDPSDTLRVTGATWRDTRSLTGGSVTIKSGVPSAVPAQVGRGAQTFVWNSLADLGFGNNRLVDLTLTLTDGTHTVTASTGAFFVSNGPLTDADVSGSNLGQVIGLASGDLTRDGRADAVLTSGLLRSYAVLPNAGQAYQAPTVKALLGLPLPVSDTLLWDGTTTVVHATPSGQVQVGDWLSLPYNLGGVVVGDPIGPRAFRVVALGAGTLTIADPDGYAGAAGGSLLPGSTRLGGPTGASFLTQRQPGQAGITALPNDLRAGECAILSVDEDLSATTSPSLDLVIANAVPVLLSATASGFPSTTQVTVSSLTPAAPLSREAYQIGMQVQVAQLAVGAESRRVTAIDASTRVLTLSSALTLPFTAGARVTSETSGAYSVHAGHQRNHCVVPIPQLAGGGMGLPGVEIATGAAFTTDLVAVDLIGPAGGADGKTDLVIVSAATLDPTSTRGAVSILRRNTAAPGFAAPIVIPVGLGGATAAFSAQATVADVTSDGLLDIVVANQGESSVTIVVQSPAGTFTAVSTIGLTAFGIPQGDVQAVAVADFDQDGLVDVAVGGAFSQRTLLLAGGDPDGPGGLVSLPAGSAARRVLSARQTPAPPAILAGAATAQPAPTLFVGFLPRRMVGADVSGDGKPDLVVVENGQGRVSVFVNRGTAGGVTSFEAVPFTTSLSPIDLDIGDVSGDGRTDVIVAGSTLGDVSRFQALVPGTLDQFFSVPTGIGPQGIAVGDLTPSFPGPELVVSNGGDTTITVFGRDGSGGLRALTPFATREIPLETQDRALLSPTPGTGALRMLLANATGLADFDQDGRLDVAIGFQTSAPDGVGGLAVLLNEGGVAPIRTTTRIVLAQGATLGVATAQVLGSSLPDLAIVELGNTVRMFRGGPGVSFTPDTALTADFPSACVPADLDKDGDMDLLVTLNTASPPNFAFFLQNPPGTLTGPFNGVTGGIQLPGFTGSSYLQSADLDGDGLEDVVFTNFLGSLLGVAYQNSPAVSPPRFDTVVPLLSLLEPAGMAVGDLDGDARADVVVAFAGESRIGVYYQRPGPNKARATAVAGPVFLPAGPSPFSVVIVDVDGDGRNDVAVTSRGANTLNVFLQR